MNVLESSIHGDSQQLVINEIEHQKALMIELHDIILPILYSHNEKTQLVQQLFEDIFSSSSKAISSLQFGSKSDNKRQAKLTRDERNGSKHRMKNTGNKRRYVYMLNDVYTYYILHPSTQITICFGFSRYVVFVMHIDIYYICLDA
jgi:hypothetical protein